MLSAITTGIINSPDIMKRALESMQSLRVPSGGYKRVTCILEDPQIFEYWYERQEFIFIDLLVAQIHRRLHEFDKANSLSACIVEKAARDHFFIPEMYVSQVNYRFVGPLGTPTGAIPMVGYGAGVYILYSLDSKF